MPKEELELRRREAYEMWKDGSPKRWVYAIPFIIVWLIILFIIIRLFFL